jgi:hypothetical protein
MTNERKPVLSNKSVHPPKNIARLEWMKFKIVIERWRSSASAWRIEKVRQEIHLHLITAADMIREL